MEEKLALSAINVPNGVDATLRRVAEFGREVAIVLVGAGASATDAIAGGGVSCRSPLKQGEWGKSAHVDVYAYT